MFALSGNTLFTVIDSLPYFGKLNATFSLFESFSPLSQSLTFYQGPKYSEEVMATHFKLANSRLTHKSYIFNLNLEKGEKSVLSAYAAIFPEPLFKSTIYTLENRTQVSNFEVERGCDSAYEFDILLLDHDLVFLQVNFKDRTLMEKVISTELKPSSSLLSSSVLLFPED